LRYEIEARGRLPLQKYFTTILNFIKILEQKSLEKRLILLNNGI